MTMTSTYSFAVVWANFSTFEGFKLGLVMKDFKRSYQNCIQLNYSYNSNPVCVCLSTTKCWFITLQDNTRSKGNVDFGSER